MEDYETGNYLEIESLVNSAILPLDQKDADLFQRLDSISSTALIVLSSLLNR